MDRVTFAGIGDEAGAGLDEQLAAIAQLGWPSIELRTIDGVAIAALDDRVFDDLLAALSERDLRVPCVSSQIAGWSRPIGGDVAADVAELDALAVRCPALGCRYVRVMSYANDGLDDDAWGARAIERLRELTARAEQSGLVLLHENCTGWAGRSAARMVELVEAIDSPAFALLFDTGNGIEHGYDARELLGEIAHLVVHVHVKDAAGGPDAATYVEPGAGDARVAESLRLLLDGGYRGVLSLEPHVALRPHVPGSGAATPGAQRLDGFVACGRALERLVAERVLPPAPAVRAASGR